MNAKICPVCFAFSGKYEGLPYDGISVTPMLDKEKILISVTTDADELKTVAEVEFPIAEQTEERFRQISKSVIGRTLLVLI